MSSTVQRTSLSIGAPVPRAGGYPISSADKRTILAALDVLRPSFPWIPARVVSTIPWDGAIFDEPIGGASYQLAVRVPDVHQGAKAAFVTKLNALLAGAHLAGIDGGRVVTIGRAGVSKLAALTDYAAYLGVPRESIAKFGDKAGKDGNDTHLCDRMSFNVGIDAPRIPAIDGSCMGQFAKGTVKLVQRLLASDRPPRAFMFDFDATLTVPGGTPGIDAQALDMLVGLVKRRVPFAICTARGPSIFAEALAPLLKKGIAPGELSRSMTMILCNGARPARPDEIVAYAKAA